MGRGAGMKEGGGGGRGAGMKEGGDGGRGAGMKEGGDGYCYRPIIAPANIQGIPASLRFLIRVGGTAAELIAGSGVRIQVGCYNGHSVGLQTHFCYSHAARPALGSLPLPAV